MEDFASGECRPAFEGALQNLLQRYWHAQPAQHAHARTSQYARHRRARHATQHLQRAHSPPPSAPSTPRTPMPRPAHGPRVLPVRLPSRNRPRDTSQSKSCWRWEMAAFPILPRPTWDPPQFLRGMLRIDCRARDRYTAGIYTHSYNFQYTHSPPPMFSAIRISYAQGNAPDKILNGCSRLLCGSGGVGRAGCGRDCWANAGDANRAGIWRGTVGIGVFDRSMARSP